jgi:hypothetical protein
MLRSRIGMTNVSPMKRPNRTKQTSSNDVSIVENFQRFVRTSLAHNGQIWVKKIGCCETYISFKPRPGIRLEWHLDEGFVHDLYARTAWTMS